MRGLVGALACKPFVACTGRVGACLQASCCLKRLRMCWQAYLEYMRAELEAAAREQEGAADAVEDHAT